MSLFNQHTRKLVRGVKESSCLRHLWTLLTNTRLCGGLRHVPESVPTLDPLLLWEDRHVVQIRNALCVQKLARELDLEWWLRNARIPTTIHVFSRAAMLDTVNRCRRAVCAIARLPRQVSIIWTVNTELDTWDIDRVPFHSISNNMANRHCAIHDHTEASIPSTRNTRDTLSFCPVTHESPVTKHRSVSRGARQEGHIKNCCKGVSCHNSSHTRQCGAPLEWVVDYNLKPEGAAPLCSTSWFHLFVPPLC